MFILMLCYCFSWICCRVCLKSNSFPILGVSCFIVSACSVGAVVIHQHNLNPNNNLLNYIFLVMALTLFFFDAIDKDGEKIFLSGVINLTLAAFVALHIFL